ncbi:hypothetical protein HALO156_90203 [Halomonas sp. 156]|nr:hypothetical protein HALO156_90203 [Halomonas sp. 156]
MLPICVAKPLLLSKIQLFAWTSLTQGGLEIALERGLDTRHL